MIRGQEIRERRKAFFRIGGARWQAEIKQYLKYCQAEDPATFPMETRRR